MALQLVNLSKQYVAPDGAVVPVIDVESFALASGEQVALVGGSGTGKTTLLHMIAGILTPDRGQILFDYEDLPAAPATPQSNGSEQRLAPPITTGESTQVLEYQAAGLRSAAGNVWTDIAVLSEAERDVFRGRNIGYIFQTHHLLPGFTALENVLLGMSFTGRAHDPAWAKHLLGEVGLNERLHFKPGRLSVGQQQRVAVARALANRPRLVLADEPTGALDPANAQQVLELIRRLSSAVKSSLLLVSHDPLISQQLPRRVRLSELNKASR